MRSLLESQLMGQYLDHMGMPALCMMLAATIVLGIGVLMGIDEKDPHAGEEFRIAGIVAIAIAVSSPWWMAYVGL